MDNYDKDPYTAWRDRLIDLVGDYQVGNLKNGLTIFGYSDHITLRISRVAKRSRLDAVVRRFWRMR